MKRTAVFLSLLLSLAVAGPVLADGKFYWSESIPPSIPNQRALLWFDGARETLLLQSKYQTPTSTGEPFGWVVPVPAAPDLASMDPRLANEWFRVADYASTPNVTRVSAILLGLLFGAVTGAAVLTLLACLLSLFVPRLRFVRRHRAVLAAGGALVLLPLPTLLLGSTSGEGIVLLFGPAVALLVLLTCVVSLFVRRLAHWRGKRAILAASALLSLAVFVMVAFSMISLGAAGLDGGLTDGIEVMESAQVGIYEVEVIRADQAGSLIDWLNGHGFQFGGTDEQVFNDYLRRGWCFVVARVDPARTEGRTAASEGLVAPLIVRFEADVPVYPLALTATANQETEILLYLFSQEKWASDGRLALHYAAGGTARGSYFSRNAERAELGVEPQGFFAGDEFALPYLCKFKGTLRPEQMRQDLVLSRAEDQEPYRKRIFVW